MYWSENRRNKTDRNSFVQDTELVCVLTLLKRTFTSAFVEKNWSVKKKWAMEIFVINKKHAQNCPSFFWPIQINLPEVAEEVLSNDQRYCLTSITNFLLQHNEPSDLSPKLAAKFFSLRQAEFCVHTFLLLHRKKTSLY